jgi:hypothetical protein
MWMLAAGVRILLAEFRPIGGDLFEWQSNISF